MVSVASVLGSNSAAAFCIGSLWAVILVVYERVADMATVPIEERGSTLETGLDILFVGGGSGVMLYLTDSRLSSFRYGLAGFVFVAIVVAIVRRYSRSQRTPRGE